MTLRPILLGLGCLLPAAPQALDFSAVQTEVDFSTKLRDWDGFGFNNVETAHAYDYEGFPQEYGGFSLFKEQERREIVELVFGADGLKVGLVKMFLGANYQSAPGGKYDHERTPKWMRYFVRNSLETTRRDGRDLTIITTLYGPPGVTNRRALVLTGRKRDSVDLANTQVRIFKQSNGSGEIVFGDGPNISPTVWSLSWGSRNYANTPALRFDALRDPDELYAVIQKAIHER